MPENYRPISLLSVFSKLLEKLVHVRVYCFWTKFNVLYDYQFGFRKNHSTDLALLDVMDTCYSNLAAGNKAVGYYLIFRKLLTR